MVQTKKTWREKCLAREEGSSDNEGSQDAPEEGNRRDAMHNGQDDTQSGENTLEVNMVFTLHTEFRAPDVAVAELRCGAERVVFKKSAKAREHMKPLYIKGHLDGKPVGCMMVEGGAVLTLCRCHCLRSSGTTKMIRSKPT
jgi:hypothetical protein